MPEILTQAYFNNPMIAYLKSLLLMLVLCLIIRIVERIVLKRMTNWAEKTKTSFDDFVLNVGQHIVVPLAYFAAFYISLLSLDLSEMLEKGIGVIVLAMIVISITRFFIALLNYGFSVYWRKRGQDVVMQKSLSGILRILRFVTWVMAVVFFLDNLGYEISAVIAGLGIGGVAVALAAQAILGDLFSYFSILFDRPFEIGDFIIIGDFMGVVENIGIKTTRINSLGGEQLIFSNSDLTSSRVRNYKRMRKRRVLFQLGVTYDTPLEKLKKIPGLLEAAVKAVPDTTFDRAHFFKYGDFNLIYEIVYYVEGPDYNKYMDIQQAINFSVKEAFEKEGVEFAFPTQTLYVNKS